MSVELNPVIIDITNTNAETLFWPPGMPYIQRVTRFYELELITGGAGSMTTDQKSFRTVRGNVFFRKPGMVTQGVAGYYAYGIAFDAIQSPERNYLYGTTIPYWITDTNTQIKDYGFFDKYPDCYQTRYFDKLEKMFSEITELYKKDRLGNQETMQDILKDIFAVIDTEWEDGQMPQVKGRILRHYDLILSCKEYIDGNLEKHFTLEELAAHCGFSKNFFIKVFKEITGMTPFEYIIESRMILARKLILTTNICIEQIVFLCGFDDRTYFYRMFKKRFHTTPALYRKEYIEKVGIEGGKRNE